MDDEIIIPVELRQRYLERRLKDIEALTKALLVDDFDLFKHIGHQIKGNASTFGYFELSEIAECLEQAGISKSKVQSMEAIEAFKAWLSRVGMVT